MLPGRVILPPRPLLLARHYAHELRVGHTRSSEWSTYRRAWLNGSLHYDVTPHPRCAACGGAKLAEVHHCVPFERNRDMELDFGNFITLCHWNGCHLLIGHGDNFRFFNPWVRKMAAAVASGEITLEEAARRAKEARQPIHRCPA